MLDQHGRTPLCTRCSLGTGSHSSDCGARFEVIWTKGLAEAEVPFRAEAEVANRAVDAVPAMEEVSTDQVVERAGGASPQLNGERVQPMKVSLDGATKRRVETQLTPHSVERQLWWS